ncbi:AraC family transcriptional regulator [Paenibacillus sp. MWE-103]|uniref:AraC family transcriptional regulator n=2 Tax=Paenibacillus artemisiicola TaxID=1172618 RepID=A0ABS3WD46_9BACL|nr:AraC family transcriptional regulator [Paenibacillus artemisiicola]
MEQPMNMNGALRYIEERLADEIDVKEAARRAYCSEYQFLRMFSFLAGLPLSEYIRRRRLTLAAFELRGGGAKVIDVALKYGYGSPDAFARAFQQLHGVTPSEARSGAGTVKAYSPVSFQLTVRGGSEMNYRIVEKDAFRIVGIMKRVAVVFEGVNPDIAAMWQSLDMATITALKDVSNVEPRGLISASANFSEDRMEERGGLDHYIGAATTEPAPDGMARLEVAASDWAVFEAVGKFPETLQEVWGRIYSEWLPSAAYELVPGPEMLWNEGKDTSLPAFRSEIWIPVRKKQAR